MSQITCNDYSFMFCRTWCFVFRTAKGDRANADSLSIPKWLMIKTSPRCGFAESLGQRAYWWRKSIFFIEINYASIIQGYLELLHWTSRNVLAKQPLGQVVDGCRSKYLWFNTLDLCQPAARIGIRWPFAKRCLLTWPRYSVRKLVSMSRFYH